MTQPAHDFRGTVHFQPGGDGGPVDHDHRQAKGARGDELGLRAAAPGILADHEVNAMFAHQRRVAIGGERAAIDDERMPGQARGHFGRVDETQEVMMLRLRGERFHMHPAEREHHLMARTAEGSDRPGHAFDMSPAIAGHRPPCRAGQGDEGNARKARRFDGMGAHRRGERVRRVDEVGNAVFPQILGKSGDSTKAADPDRDGLHAGRSRAAGVTERRRDAFIRQQHGQRAGFGGPTQQEDFRHG